MTSRSAALLCLLAAASASAQPMPASQSQYGDRQSGNFGDTDQGHFGDDGQGEFIRHNFRRDQEGSVAPTPGVPKRFRGVEPPPRLKATEQAQPAAPAAVTPYVVLDRPPGSPAPKKKKSESSDSKRR